jgi:hypothetical protein
VRILYVNMGNYQKKKEEEEEEETHVGALCGYREMR